MKKQTHKSLINCLQRLIKEIDKVCKNARKFKKTLSGDNYYGNKFDELRIELNRIKAELELIAKTASNSGLKQALKNLEPYFDLLLNAKTKQKERTYAKKQLLFILQSEIEPLIGKCKVRKAPATDKVIPMSIVRGTRGYIELIALQANGCYEFDWFDACAVMIRRLVETLIIECFESHAIADKIKDEKGDYFFLRDLIDACLNETTWSLGRNTKKTLPSLKDVGDLSAHSRRYLAKQSDIDRILKGLRITVEELVFLAKLKK